MSPSNIQLQGREWLTMTIVVMVTLAWATRQRMTNDDDDDDHDEDNNDDDDDNNDDDDDD